MAELIGVYSADGGLLAEFRRMLGRRVALTPAGSPNSPTHPPNPPQSGGL